MLVEEPNGFKKCNPLSIVGRTLVKQFRQEDRTKKKKGMKIRDRTNRVIDRGSD